MSTSADSTVSASSDMPKCTRTERRTKDDSSKHDSAVRTVTRHVPTLSHSESSSEPCSLTREATPPSTQACVDTDIDYGRMGAQLSMPALVDRNRENFQSRKDGEDQGQQATNEPQTPRVLRVTNGISLPSSSETTSCERNQRQLPVKTRSHPHPGDLVSIEQRKINQSAFKLHIQKKIEGWEARKSRLEMFDDAIGRFCNNVCSKNCYHDFYRRAKSWRQTYDRFLMSDRDLVTMDDFDWAIFLMKTLEAEARMLEGKMDAIDGHGHGYDTATDNSSASFFFDRTGSSTKCGFLKRLRCWK